ncbi:: hypothetical protein [Arcticibacter svalbardensis MN12-7]|uniref:Glycoside hydrolase family 42 N-terminal domain-containing protein n=1 Tax=Arcticibacter svalbardensis MN12-7 TaxID=1150600 RepID=R9GMQ1_9SPHI|nr:hypothetical protein [Arcticibacter svalbardensis]EOR92815.1 : hypothetical protein [Arcticibacter svalbardensis MN12-7]
MKKTISLLFVLFTLIFKNLSAQSISYVPKFANENHPEIGYWFISPDLLKNDRYLDELDSIINLCPYTMVFLTAREGNNFYETEKMHPYFEKIVSKAHKSGIKIGLQLWGNYFDEDLNNSQRMIVEQEIQLDQKGKASYTAKAKYIRFEDRLLKTDIFKVYAFKKTGDGFYDPSSLKDITSLCTTTLPDKKTAKISINGGEALKGLTVCIMVQQFCSQNSMWDDVEINGFKKTIDAYSDIPFDGMALDEYGNKFIPRFVDMPANEQIFRGRWYSNAMAKAYEKETKKSLVKTLFEGRYAPTGQPEVRIKAINQYMDFTRGGAVRVIKAVADYGKKTFSPNTFTGIHNTYHAGLYSDEIWADGICWWVLPHQYGQTDEHTITATQMGIAFNTKENVMYNQFYDGVFPPVQEKALADLRYGIRTHYHALHDKRVNRFDLLDPEAVKGINKVEDCARLLNKFNPSLPDVKLLVIFGMEALSNWYPNYKDRGVYDVNDKLNIEEKADELWKAGYLNALVPSDFINSKLIKLNKEGKPEINGHTFDAVVYLYPQYAKENELKFLEEYQNRGGKLMLEGVALLDFNAQNVSKRFQSIYNNATVKGYSVKGISKLGIAKNGLADGSKNSDGSYVFTDLNSIRTDSLATFSVNIDGDLYGGKYKGLAIIKADKNNGITKFAANGFTELSKNEKKILAFKTGQNVFYTKQNGEASLIIKDEQQQIKPLINTLSTN